MWIGGDPRTGVFLLGVMVRIRSALIVLRRPQRNVRGLRGDGRDERFKQIDLAGDRDRQVIVLITVVIGAFLVEVARVQDGSPYSQLGAVGGVAYVVAIVVLRLRG